jgi:hypothetical protein
MSIMVEVDVSRIQARLDKMINRVAEFGSTGMPAELMAWQVEDIHRKFPHVDTPDAVTAVMHIDTHVHQLVTVSSSRGGRKRAVYRRPVLRPELIDRLCERMAERMSGDLSWR